MSTEIDRQVAELIGREYIAIGYRGTDGESPRQKELTEWMIENGLRYVGEYYIDEAKNWWMEASDWTPTTDMNQAMQVWIASGQLDSMRHWPYTPHLVPPPFPTDVSPFWDVCSCDGVFTVHESLPMAICLAALKAKGIDTEADNA